MRKGPSQYIRKDGRLESAADQLLQRQQQLRYGRQLQPRKGLLELIDKGDYRPLSRHGRMGFGWRFLSQPSAKDFYFYLPHYSIRTYKDNNLTLPDIALRWTATNEQVLEENEELARLEVNLVATTPKASSRRRLREIPHRLELALHFLSLDNDGNPLHEHKLPFDNLVDIGDNNFFASLVITDLKQLASIYLALANQEQANAQLQLNGYADMVVSQSLNMLDLETLNHPQFQQQLWQRGLKAETLFDSQSLQKSIKKPFSRDRKRLKLKQARRNAHSSSSLERQPILNPNDNLRLQPIVIPDRLLLEKPWLIEKQLLEQNQLQLLLRKDKSLFTEIHKNKLHDKKTIDRIIQEKTLDTSGMDKETISNRLKQSPVKIDNRRAITLNQIDAANKSKQLISTRELCAKKRLGIHYPELNYGQLYSSIPAAVRNDINGLENPNLLIAFNVRVGSKLEVIYQDPWQKNLFYYLPQSFKLGRADTPPYEPLLRIGFNELALEPEQQDDDSGTDDSGMSSVDIDYRAEITYTLKPHIDSDFFYAIQHDSVIQQAAQGQAVVLAPLNPGTPKVDIQDSLQGTITDIIASVSEGITVTSEYAAADFGAFFASLVNDAGLPAINGLVTLPELANGQLDIPLSLSLYDTSGPLVNQYWQAISESDTAGQYRVTITNPLESQLTLTQLQAQLLSENNATANLNASPALVLQPGNKASIDITVSPADSKVNDLVIDSEYQVQLDIDRLWDLLTINHGISSYAYNIDVIAEYPSLFGTSADPQNLPPLTAIKVEFKEGPSITLDADQPQASALLYKSLLADLQDQPLTEQYHYRITNMHGDEEWARGNWAISNGSLRVAPVYPSEQTGTLSVREQD